MSDLLIKILSDLGPFLLAGLSWAVGIILTQARRELTKAMAAIEATRQEITQALSDQAGRFADRADQIDHNLTRLARNVEVRMVELESNCRYTHGVSTDRRRNHSLSAPSWAERTDPQGNSGA